MVPLLHSHLPPLVLRGTARTTLHHHAHHRACHLYHLHEAPPSPLRPTPQPARLTRHPRLSCSATTQTRVPTLYISTTLVLTASCSTRSLCTKTSLLKRRRHRQASSTACSAKRAHMPLANNLINSIPSTIQLDARFPCLLLSFGNPSHDLAERDSEEMGLWEYDMISDEGCLTGLDISFQLCQNNCITRCFLGAFAQIRHKHCRAFFRDINMNIFQPIVG